MTCHIEIYFIFRNTTHSGHFDPLLGLQLVRVLHNLFSELGGDEKFLVTGFIFTHTIDTTFVFNRALDPDPHVSAYIFPPGSGSAFIFGAGLGAAFCAGLRPNRVERAPQQWRHLLSIENILFIKLFMPKPY